MRKLIERLLARLGYVRSAPAVVAPVRPTLEQACFEFGVREAQLRQQFANGIQAARCEAYQVGYAQGELAGRMELHREIAVQYGVDGGEHNMTTDDITRIGTRQLH